SFPTRRSSDLIERKKKRHLNQQRQTAAERVRFLHQTQLLHLQLFHARLGRLHSLQLFLKFLHARRVLLRLLHLARRLPLEREEERINEDGEENDRDAITPSQSLQRVNRPENRTSQTTPEPGENAVVNCFAEIDLRPAQLGNLFTRVVE